MISLSVTFRNSVCNDEFANGELSCLLSSLESDDFSISLSQHMFLQEGKSPKDDFLNTMDKFFHTGQVAPVGEIDFGNPRKAAKKINGWVEKETKNNIKDLVSPKMLKKDTNLIMVNGIHFKARWEKPFDRSNRETFYSENMTKRSVSMMELNGANFKVSLSSKSLMVNLIFNS